LGVAVAFHSQMTLFSHAVCDGSDEQRSVQMPRCESHSHVCDWSQSIWLRCDTWHVRRHDCSG
jgi:hypothetical protein